MNLKSKFSSYGLGGLLAAFLVSAVGLALLLSDTSLSRLLDQASYDLSCSLSRFAQQDAKGSDAIIVYLDEKSYKDLDQPQNVPLDRTFQAKLLDKMRVDGAKVTVMDIVFSDPGPSGQEQADKLFADALAANGRVVLGVDYNRSDKDRQTSDGRMKGVVVTIPSIHEVLTFPYEPFEKAMARGGMVVMTPDRDLTGRKHLHNLELDDLRHIVPEERGLAPASLSWEAARLVGVKLPPDPAKDPTERWVNYYGPPGEAIRGVSYSEALIEPPGFFHDKVVFVGARPKTGMWDERRDELRSPYSLPGGKFLFMPMVEIHATEFLNLERGDWLARPLPAIESVMLMRLRRWYLGVGLLQFRLLGRRLGWPSSEFWRSCLSFKRCLRSSMFGLRG